MAERLTNEDGQPGNLHGLMVPSRGYEGTVREEGVEAYQTLCLNDAVIWRLLELAKRSSGVKRLLVFEGRRYFFTANVYGEDLLAVNVTEAGSESARHFDVGISIRKSAPRFVSTCSVKNFSVEALHSLFWGAQILEADEEEVEKYLDGPTIYQLISLSLLNELKLEFDGKEYEVKVATGGTNLVFSIKEFDEEGNKLRDFVRHYAIDDDRFIHGLQPENPDFFKRFLDKMIAEAVPAAMGVIDVSE